MIILVDFNVKYPRFRPWKYADKYRNYIKVRDEISGDDFLLWYKDGVKLYKLIPKMYYHLQRISGYQFIEVEEKPTQFESILYSGNDAKDICYKKMPTKKQLNQLKLEYPEYFI